MIEGASTRPRLLSSLRWRVLVAISGVVLLCTAVCIAAAVLFLGQALTDRATTEMRNTLNGVSGYLSDQGADLHGAAQLLGDDPVIQKDVLTGNRSALIVHLNPIFADLNVGIMDIVDAHGRMLVRMEDTLTYGDYVGSLPDVRTALAAGDVIAYGRDLVDGQAAGSYALRATIPIRYTSGGNTRIVGVVVVGRQLDTTFADRIGHALSAQVNLIAANQRVGTTITDSHGLPVTGLPEPASVLARIPTGTASIAQVHEDGHISLSGLVPFEGANDGHWIGAVEVVRPLDSVSDVIRRLSFLLLALGAVVVALGMLLALYISRRVTSRLRVLEATASRVASVAHSDAPLGDMVITGPVEGSDEVASLARSFSAMMQALDERIAANAHLYEAAQARVRELSGLAEIARLLTAEPSIQETVGILGEHVCRLVGVEAVAIWLPGEGSRPALYGGHGLPDGYETLTFEALTQGSGQPFETAAQYVIRTGEVRYQSLVDPLPERMTASHRALRDLMRARGCTSATAVPLRVKDRVVGALTCYSVSPDPLSISDQSLLTTIADQVAVAVENARLYVQSRDLAALEERQRLARELHDSVSQALYGIALGARTARELLDRDPAQVVEPLEYVLTQAQAGLTEMRALIFELRPEALETQGLVTALIKHTESLQVRHGIAVHTHLCVEPDIPLAAKEALHRIAQEAMHNILKHARARNVELHLECDGEGIALFISDDGAGFDPGGLFPGHLGLRTMRERATRLGGTLQVESSPGSGTRIRVRVPALAQGTAA